MVRFLAKVKKTSKCWIWIGGFSSKGYGSFWWKGRPWKAHRVAYSIFKGRIPKGLFILHKCDNPACVRPKHLFAGTNQDNMDDMMRKGRYRPHGRGGMKGSHHVFAKLSDKQVEEIRAIEGMTQKEIAEIYGVDRSRISCIRNHKSY